MNVTDLNNPELAEIARAHLNIETLATRYSDSLDFHDVAVWNVLAALKAAYEAGRRDQRDAWEGFAAQPEQQPAR